MAQKESKEKGKAVPVRDVVPTRPRALARWPFSTLERELDRLWEDFGMPLWPRLGGRERWPAGVEMGTPSVDVYERDDEVVVKAEVPGLTKDDVEVNLTESTLTIKGEKKREEEVKEENYYRAERSFGAFARTVQLPSEIQGDQAKATFKDGVLEIRIPRAEGAKRKTIKVKVD